MRELHAFRCPRRAWALLSTRILPREDAGRVWTRARAPLLPGVDGPRRGTLPALPRWSGQGSMLYLTTLTTPGWTSGHRRFRFITSTCP